MLKKLVIFATAIFALMLSSQVWAAEDCNVNYKYERVDCIAPNGAHVTVNMRDQYGRPKTESQIGTELREAFFYAGQQARPQTRQNYRGNNYSYNRPGQGNSQQMLQQLLGAVLKK